MFRNIFIFLIYVMVAGCANDVQRVKQKAGTINFVESDSCLFNAINEDDLSNAWPVNYDYDETIWQFIFNCRSKMEGEVGSRIIGSKDSTDDYLLVESIVSSKSSVEYQSVIILLNDETRVFYTNFVKSETSANHSEILREVDLISNKIISSFTYGSPIYSDKPIKLLYDSIPDKLINKNLEYPSTFCQNFMNFYLITVCGHRTKRDIIIYNNRCNDPTNFCNCDTVLNDQSKRNALYEIDELISVARYTRH